MNQKELHQQKTIEITLDAELAKFIEDIANKRNITENEAAKQLVVLAWYVNELLTDKVVISGKDSRKRKVSHEEHQSRNWFEIIVFIAFAIGALLAIIYVSIN